jgi:hypothetical protein
MSEVSGNYNVSPRSSISGNEIVAVSESSSKSLQEIGNVKELSRHQSRASLSESPSSKGKSPAVSQESQGSDPLVESDPELEIIDIEVDRPPLANEPRCAPSGLPERPWTQEFTRAMYGDPAQRIRLDAYREWRAVVGVVSLGASANVAGLVLTRFFPEIAYWAVPLCGTALGLSVGFLLLVFSITLLQRGECVPPRESNLS